MTRTFVACTVEVDDKDLAISEIRSQLGIDTNLLANSVGIISCHYEFVLSGVAKAVCDALPFDVLGIVSAYQFVDAQPEHISMTIMLITSDDVEFVSVRTPALIGPYGDIIEQSYTDAISTRSDKPALVMAFASFLTANSGDEYVDVISRVSGDVPFFGTLAIDDTPELTYCYMLYNGEHYAAGMSMLLAYGNLSPKFYVANISSEKVLGKTAVITKSVGHVIMEVNGNSVEAYLQELGLKSAAKTAYAMSNVPFLLDYNDGTPKVSKIFVTMTPEGYALCAGSVPEGSGLQLAITDKDDVLFTTGEAMDQIMSDIDVSGASGMLVCSCISRLLALGVSQSDEVELVNSKVLGKFPVMMTYSGGEICPTLIREGKSINRFHNNAFAACVF